VGPAGATETLEISDRVAVTAASAPADAVPVESVPLDVAPPDTVPGAIAAEALPIAETVASIEISALLPEAPEEALEAPRTRAVPDAGGPEEHEDSAMQDAPAPEIAREGRQAPGVQDQYFRALRDWLDRHKDYPRVSQRRGEEGTVVLAFTLNRYGMVLEHAIIRGSGHTMLDNTVEHLIRRAQPLPPIPPEMNAEILQVIVPIEFRLER
jgi:periplasmic protein TonB